MSGVFSSDEEGPVTMPEPLPSMDEDLGSSGDDARFNSSSPVPTRSAEESSSSGDEEQSELSTPPVEAPKAPTPAPAPDSDDSDYRVATDASPDKLSENQRDNLPAIEVWKRVLLNTVDHAGRKDLGYVAVGNVIITPEELYTCAFKEVTREKLSIANSETLADEFWSCYHTDHLFQNLVDSVRKNRTSVTEVTDSVRRFSNTFIGSLYSSSKSRGSLGGALNGMTDEITKQKLGITTIGPGRFQSYPAKLAQIIAAALSSYAGTIPAGLVKPPTLDPNIMDYLIANVPESTLLKPWQSQINFEIVLKAESPAAFGLFKRVRNSYKGSTAFRDVFHRPGDTFGDVLGSLRGSYADILTSTTTTNANPGPRDFPWRNLTALEIDQHKADDKLYCAMATKPPELSNWFYVGMGAIALIIASQRVGKVTKEQANQMFINAMCSGAITATAHTFVTQALALAGDPFDVQQKISEYSVDNGISYQAARHQLRVFASLLVTVACVAQQGFTGNKELSKAFGHTATITCLALGHVVAPLASLHVDPEYQSWFMAAPLVSSTMVAMFSPSPAIWRRWEYFFQIGCMNFALYLVALAVPTGTKGAMALTEGSPQAAASVAQPAASRAAVSIRKKKKKKKEPKAYNRRPPR